MKIDILCSSPDHPVNPWLKCWMERNRDRHTVDLYREKGELRGGDILFLVSCTQLVERGIRDLYRHTLVLHASDLPKGRGWSPHIWAILQGADRVTVSLLDAEDAVDSGAIWAKRTFGVPRGSLHDEINSALFETELALMSEGVRLISEGAQPLPQANEEPSYYRRRTPADSELDPAKPLVDLFDQIRVSDPQRYPAYFQIYGQKYTIELKKVGKADG